MYVWKTTTQTSKRCVTCKNTFKERFDYNATTYRNKIKQKSAELSKYIWELHEKSIQHQKNLSKASKALPYNYCTRNGDPCLIEKLMMAKADPSVPLGQLFPNAGIQMIIMLSW